MQNLAVHFTSSFEPESGRQLLRTIPTQQFGYRSDIYRPNRPTQTIYQIVKGKVKLTHHGRDGREMIKCILGEGDFFGATLESQSPQGEGASVQSSTAIVRTIHPTEFTKLIQKHPHLLKELMQSLQNRISHQETTLEAAFFASSQTRVLRFLIRYIEQHGRSVGFESVVDRPLTQGEIAATVGTSRQTVAKLMSELRQQGLIRYNRRYLIISDLDQLKAYQPTNE